MKVDAASVWVSPETFEAVELFFFDNRLETSSEAERLAEYILNHKAKEFTITVRRYKGF